MPPCHPEVEKRCSYCLRRALKSRQKIRMVGELSTWHHHILMHHRKYNFSLRKVLILRHRSLMEQQLLTWQCTTLIKTPSRHSWKEALFQGRSMISFLSVKAINHGSTGDGVKYKKC